MPTNLRSRAAAAGVLVSLAAVPLAAQVSEAAPAKSRTVSTASTRLGRILVDGGGHTLYLFKKDKNGKSSCTGACAKAWPPLRVTGKPTVGGALKASKVGTTRRSDGRAQVTYNGHPLYRFAGDRKAGDTNGEGLTAFGASWFVLSSAGRQVSAPASSSNGGSSNTGSGTGY